MNTPGAVINSARPRPVEHESAAAPDARTRAGMPRGRSVKSSPEASPAEAWRRILLAGTKEATGGRA